MPTYANARQKGMCSLLEIIAYLENHLTLNLLQSVMKVCAILAIIIQSDLPNPPLVDLPKW